MDVAADFQKTFGKSYIRLRVGDVKVEIIVVIIYILMMIKKSVTSKT